MQPPLLGEKCAAEFYAHLRAVIGERHISKTKKKEEEEAHISPHTTCEPLVHTLRAL